MKEGRPTARSLSAFGWEMRPCSRLSTVAGPTPAALAVPRMDRPLASRRVRSSRARVSRWDGVIGSTPVSALIIAQLLSELNVLVLIPQQDRLPTVRPFIGIEDEAAAVIMRRVVDPEVAGLLEVA